MNWSRIGLVTSAIGVGHALSQPTPTSSEDMDNISGPEKIGIAVAAVGGAGIAAYGLGSGVIKTGELAWENRDAIAKGVGKAVGRGVSHLAIPAAKGAVQAVVGPAVGILDAVSKIAVTEDPVRFKNNIDINTLIKRGYSNNHINIILSHGNDSDVTEFAKKDKVKSNKKSNRHSGSTIDYAPKVFDK